jgi:serine/threonine protein kinase
LSLESEFEEVKKEFGFNPQGLIGKVFQGYEIDRYVGHGTMGVVFHAVKKEIGDEAACKIIPQDNIKGWKTELIKLVKLTDVSQVVQYKGHGVDMIEEIPLVFVLYQFVDGKNLREYVRDYPDLITLDFVEMLAREILNVLQALKVSDIAHGDLHEGNIMVADPDPKFIDRKPRIKVTDFGIGTSSTKQSIKDDYLQLAVICSNLVRKYIDPASLDGENRYFYNRFTTDFLRKQLTELDVTVGEFAREPAKLLENLEEIRLQYKEMAMIETLSKLTRPFDYLSCEHFGDSFELLQTLYSESFPGYQELNRKINTILTGPRGCGKTTIFRNLSLKTQLLGKKVKSPERFVGIYYHCSDLSFAFPYTIEKLGTTEQKTITHFFNLAILHEVLDTLIVADAHDLKVPSRTLERLQGFLQGWLVSYQNPPRDTSVLRHLLSLIGAAKERFRDEMDRHGMEIEKWPVDSCRMALLPQDFLKRLCKLLQDCVPWLKGVPFYFFLDDYSLPKVSNEVQVTLHNFILNRYSELFFKISTESVVTFNPQDAKGKMFEEGREYEIIDLGDYFLDANDETKQKFLGDIANNRLRNAEKFEWDCRIIELLLGNPPYETYVELAELIKSGKKVRYSGWKTIVDLCSGDIANILRLIRNVFSLAKLKEIREYPISEMIQDQGIRETSSKFFEKFKAIPDTGPHIARIVQAFGDVANYYLRTRRSKNIKTNPPYQAFRIELLETVNLDEDEPYRKLGAQHPLEKGYLRRLFDDLIKYGVFLRDIKGKSQRGIVVPRLYLRRLLIPTFLLTPSKRDHIRVNATEFQMLLAEPEKFKTHMIGKPYREVAPEGKQRRLDK